MRRQSFRFRLAWISAGLSGLVLLVFGTVWLVLLMAIANVSNLMLGQALAHRHEIAVQAMSTSRLMMTPPRETMLPRRMPSTVRDVTPSVMLSPKQRILLNGGPAALCSRFLGAAARDTSCSD